MSDRNQELIEKLALLGDQLHRVVVSATIDADGRLGKITGISEKIKAVVGDVHNVACIGLARDQPGESGQPLSGDRWFKGRIVGAEGEDTGCRQPIVLADDIESLVDGLLKTLEVSKHYGRRLGLPPELKADDPRYGEAHCFGRDWLRREVANFISSSQHKCGYVVLAAPAIWGKTSFALDWYRKTVGGVPGELPPLAGWAFIRKEAGGEWVDPVTVLLGLEAEARYWRNLRFSKGEAPRASDFGSLDGERVLESHVRDFLSELGADAQRTDRPAVLLLDGIDEIWGPSGVRPRNFLPGALPQALPEGVFVVLLSRPGYHLRWQGGIPNCPLLKLDMGEALAPSRSRADGEDSLADTLRTHIHSDVDQYIDHRATQIEGDTERSGAEGALETAARVRRLKRALIDASQGYLFVAGALLAQDAELSHRLEEWEATPESIPKGPRSLVVGIIARILTRLDRAQEEGGLSKLDRIYYAQQTLACLALCACLREPLHMGALKRLLFDGEGTLRAGRIDQPRDIGPLARRKLTEDVFDEALGFAAECFAGKTGLKLPASSAFFHPLMRDCVGAAWATTVLNGGEIPDRNAVVDALDNPGRDECHALHHVLAAAASCDWADWARDREHYDAREALAYALAWGPWHATQCGDTQAAQVAADVMQDSAHLQQVYRLFGALAHVPLNDGHDALLADGKHPDHGRLFNIRRSLVHHDAALSNGESSVAGVLWNDLCGLEPEGSAWRKQLDEATRDICRRRTPGVPGAFGRVLRGTEVAFSPCGRWMAVADGNAIVIYDIAAGMFRMGNGWRIEWDTRLAAGMAFSPAIPNGNVWLASASGDGDVGLLELNDDGPVEAEWRLIESHRAVVFVVAFSPVLSNGSVWLAGGSTSGPLSILEIGGEGPVAAEFRLIECFADAVLGVAFSPPLANGKVWLAAAARDGRIGLLEFGGGGLVAPAFRLVDGHAAPVRNVAFSPELDKGVVLLASASDDGKIGLLEVEGDGPAVARLRMLEGHTGRVGNVAFSPVFANGDVWLAGASWDGTIGLVQVRGEKGGATELRVIEKHADAVVDVAFSPSLANGSVWLTSASDDGTIGFLKVGADGPAAFGLRRIGGHNGGVHCVVFSPKLANGNVWLASSSGERRVGLLEVGSYAPASSDVPSTNGDTEWYRRWDLSDALRSGGVMFASVSESGRMSVLEWGADGSKAEHPIENNFGVVWNVAFSPVLTNGNVWLASACKDGRISLQQVGGGTVALGLRLVEGHAHGLRLAFSPVLTSGYVWLAITLGEGRICLLEVGPDGPTAAGLRMIVGHLDESLRPAYSPVLANGNLWLAGGSEDGQIGLIEVGRDGPSTMALHMIEMHAAEVTCLVFSPVLLNGNVWLASACEDGRIGLIEVGTDGPEVGGGRLIESEASWDHFVAFSPVFPNGNVWLASGFEDGRIGLLEVGIDGPTAVGLRRLDGHNGRVRSVAFSPPLRNGVFLMASASSSEIVIRTVPDGKVIAGISFISTDEAALELRWGEEGTRLYVVGVRANKIADLAITIPGFW